MRRKTLLVYVIGFLSACTSTVDPGPDQQARGTLSGALTGAGTGAVTGLQIGAGTGPGALVGAGFGALAGGIKGAVVDVEETRLAALEHQRRFLQRRIVAQRQLEQHFQERQKFYPSRDLFSAETFFQGDSTKLCASGRGLIEEIARLSVDRLPWSRLAVTSYVVASEKESEYAHHLAGERAKSIGNELVRNGIDPRRVYARALIVPKPVLEAGDKVQGDYNQAIEFSLLDAE
jgi:outer membrane protein OmpA-like peptidoglycan-associated protein